MEFPKFHELTFEKNFYEIHEDEYVPWKLNEIKKELNAKIVEKEQTNIRAAEFFFSQELNNFEQDEINRISKVLEAADNRKSLKSTTIKVMRQRQNEELTQKSENLKTDHQRALDEEKQRYEAAVKSISDTYNQSLQQLEQQLDNKYYEETNRKYQEQYYEETARLQDLLDLEYRQLEMKKQQKQQELVNQIHEISSKVGKTIFEKRIAQMKKVEYKLISEHDYAKKLHLVERQELLKLNQTQDMSKYIVDLQEQVSAMVQERKRFEAETHAMQQLLFDTKNKALQDQIDLSGKLVDVTLKKAIAN